MWEIRKNDEGLYCVEWKVVVYFMDVLCGEFVIWCDDEGIVSGDDRVEFLSDMSVVLE